MKRSAKTLFYFPKNDGDIKGIFRQRNDLHVKVEGKTHEDQIIYNKIASNVLNDEGGSSCWYSPDEKDSTITISFNKFYLMVTNYSFQAPFNNCTTHYFPKQWNFYGFNGNDWVLISSQTTNDLTEYGKIKTFSPQNIKHFEVFNKFKFVGGLSLQNSYIFVIQALDLFGVLYNFNYFTYFRQHLSSTFLHLLFISLFICFK